MSLVIFSASTAQAQIGNVCITVENISANAISLEAFDTIDQGHWIMLTGGPLRIAPKSTGHGCFKTYHEPDGVDIRATSAYMGDAIAGGGLAMQDVSVEDEYSGKMIQTTSASYKGFIGTFNNGDTLVIQ